MNMRRITRFTYVLAITVLIVGLSACDQLVSILSDGDMPEIQGGEISIGAVLPLTGRLAISFGQPMETRLGAGTGRD